MIEIYSGKIPIHRQRLFSVAVKAFLDGNNGASLQPPHYLVARHAPRRRTVLFVSMCAIFNPEGSDCPYAYWKN